MPRVGFEPKIPVFERPKTVRDSDRSATGTGLIFIQSEFFQESDKFRLH
jgi:hypothetical protein